MQLFHSSLGQNNHVYESSTQWQLMFGKADITLWQRNWIQTILCVMFVSLDDVCTYFSRFSLSSVWQNLEKLLRCIYRTFVCADNNRFSDLCQHCAPSWAPKFDNAHAETRTYSTNKNIFSTSNFFLLHVIRSKLSWKWHWHQKNGWCFLLYVFRR